MPTKRYDSHRLSKTAAGEHPQLCVTLIPAGNGTNPVTLNPGGYWPKASRRDAIVSVIEMDTTGSGGTALAFTDRTATANVAAGGSLIPGAGLQGPAVVTWFHFEG
jgi:hypothetical protein